jgi:hypothetical protein
MSSRSIVSVTVFLLIICSWSGMALNINGGSGWSGSGVSFNIATNLDDSTNFESKVSLNQLTLGKVTKASGSGENSIMESVSNGGNGIDNVVLSSGSLDMQSSTIASSRGVASSQQANLKGDKGYIANGMSSPSGDIDLTAGFSGLGGYLNTNIESIAAGSANVAGSANIIGEEYLDPEAIETINSLSGTVLKSVDGLYQTHNGDIGSFGLNVLKQDRSYSTWTWGDDTKPLYRWPDNSKIKLVLNTKNLPSGISLSQASKTINDAANTWDKVTSQNLFYGDETSTKNVVVSTSSTAKPNFNRFDQKNVHAFGSYSDPNVIAVTNTWYYTSGLKAKGDGTSLGRAIDSDCIYNNAFKWSIDPTDTTFELGDIALHELGHTLGLPDFYGIGTIQENWVMYGYRGLNDLPRTLTSDDRNMLQYLYGQ